MNKENEQMWSFGDYFKDVASLNENKLEIRS